MLLCVCLCIVICVEDLHVVLVERRVRLREQREGHVEDGAEGVHRGDRVA